MTIGEFLKLDLCRGRLVIYGHTDNEHIRESHKVYDSGLKRCEGKPISENVLSQELSAIGSTLDGDGVCLHYKTEKCIYEYL